MGRTPRYSSPFTTPIMTLDQIKANSDAGPERVSPDHHSPSAPSAPNESETVNEKSRGKTPDKRNERTRQRKAQHTTPFLTFKETIEARENYPPTWAKFLAIQIPNLQVINNKIKREEIDETRLSPWPCDIFAPFHLTPLDENLRVILFYDGPSTDWDPETGEPHALGYALGHRHPEKYAPLNLVARGACVYRSRVRPDLTFDPERDFDYTLRSWAREGVLLLNVTPLRKRMRVQNPKHPDTTFHETFSVFYSELFKYIAKYVPHPSSPDDVPMECDVVVAVFGGIGAYMLLGSESIRTFGNPIIGPNIDDPNTTPDRVANMFEQINRKLYDKGLAPVKF